MRSTRSFPVSVQLNRTLLANAGFSLCSGLIMLLAAQPLASLMGNHDPLVYRIIGGGLLLFAADIFFTVRKGVSFTKGLYFVLGDFAWVAGSAFLLLARAEWFSETGRWVVGIVAMIVLTFGALQDVFLFKARSLAKATA